MGKARNYNNNQYSNTQDTQKLSVTSLRELETYKDGKIIDEEINVGLSNIYVDIDVPKNLIDYNWFCEKVAQSVSKTMVEKCAFGFVISDGFYKHYGVDDEESDIDDEQKSKDGKKLFTPAHFDLIIVDE